VLAEATSVTSRRVVTSGAVSMNMRVSNAVGWSAGGRVNHHELVGIAIGQEDQIRQIRGGLDTGHQAGQDDACESKDPATSMRTHGSSSFYMSRVIKTPRITNEAP
jgi:hypothetical protein